MRDLFYDVIKMPEKQSISFVTHGKWFQRFLRHQLAFSSCEFYSSTIFKMAIYGYSCKNYL